MTDDAPPTTPTADQARAKRERILAVSRTVHQVPVEEGGMLKRKPASAAAPSDDRQERFWRRAALTAGGFAALAGGFAAGLWIRRPN